MDDESNVSISSLFFFHAVKTMGLITVLGSSGLAQKMFKNA
jgi:hypothetical protein